ncbi:heparin lyase I family protein [Limimaricola variabilis]
MRFSFSIIHLMTRVVAIAVLSFPALAHAELRVERSLNDTPHGFLRVSSPVRAGRTAQYFELRHGDCGADRWHSDCATDRERTEVWLPDNQWGPGTLQWIGYSIYLPPDFPGIDPLGTVAGQIHMQGGPTNMRGGHPSQPGVLLMDLNQSGYTACVIRLSGPRQAVQDDCLHVQIATLDQMRGRWTDIQIGLDLRRQGGSIEIWANGRLVKRVEGFHPHMGERYYFKYGLYRSFISRYPGRIPTQWVVFDEVRLGQSREEVVVREQAPVN